MLLYQSKSHPWDSLDLLRDLTPSAIQMTPEERAAREAFLWDDLCSEYDAEFLCLRLEASALPFSAEFHSFEKAWRRDEFNHYLGFRRLYSLIYGEAEEAITVRLNQRVADFAFIDRLFHDEFRLCLLLAYDELCTVRAYSHDVAFYQTLGSPILMTWVHRVRADEALHYLNALRVAQVCYPQRLAEAPAVLHEILEMDLNGIQYQATFVLDHTGPAYTPAMLQECAATVLEVLQRPH